MLYIHIDYSYELVVCCLYTSPIFACIIRLLGAVCRVGGGITGVEWIVFFIELLDLVKLTLKILEKQN